MIEPDAPGELYAGFFEAYRLAEVHGKAQNLTSDTAGHRITAVKRWQEGAEPRF